MSTINLFILLFLVSCQLPGQKPKVWIGEKCSENQRKNECYCRDWKESSDYVGFVSGVRTHSLDYCQGLIGFKPKIHASNWAFHEEIRQEIQNEESGKSKTTSKPSSDLRRHEAREVLQAND